MPASVRSRRGLRAVVVIVVAVLLVYGTVVALYAVDQASRIVAACDDPGDDAVVEIAPRSVDALQDRIAATVRVTEDGPLAVTDLGYAGPVTLIVNGTDGDRSFTTPAETIPGRVSLTLLSDGEIAQWPFDVHIAEAQIVLVQTVDGAPAAYLPQVCAQGQVSGWVLTATEGPGSDEFTVGEDREPVPSVVITATRSPATVAFGLVILALMTALPVLGLTVAIAAFRGRRKTEATLMSWMGAMLFAVVPLRGFLPGSPPVGSWVDYLVVLWVVGGLVAALVVYVAAWLRWTPAAGERPAR